MASELRDLADEYEALTGENIFCFASQPRPGDPTNYVFQEESFQSRRVAIQYLKVKLQEARVSHETPENNVDTER